MEPYISLRSYTIRRTPYKLLGMVQVLIASPGNKDLLQERCKLAAQLWNANIPAECGIEKKPGFMDQIKRAEKEGIPVVVVMGEEEIEKVMAFPCVQLTGLRLPAEQWQLWTK